MSNPAPTLNQINAFNATQGTTIDFNIIGGTEVIRSNKIYIYDLSDNSLICTHLYVSTESIHELPPNTSSSIVYESGKSSADFTNNTQYYAQIQTFTDIAGTEGGSGLSIAKLFWCLPTPTLTLSTIPTTISTTSYNVSATYNANTSVVSNIIQQYQFSLYSATGSLLQSSGVIVGSGEQQGTSTAYDISYNFTGLSVGSSYYVAVDVTTTQGMSVNAQSSTFTVSIDTPTLGEATVVNNACDGYISVTSNLSSEYGGSASGEIVSFETDSENVFTKLQVDLEPVQDLHGYDKPWVGGSGKNKLQQSWASPLTHNGVTFTRNSDGSVTATGATGDSADAYCFAQFSLPIGDYYFTGCASGGSAESSNAWNVYMWNATTNARLKQWNGTTNAATNVNTTTLLQVQVPNTTDSIYYVMRVMRGTTLPTGGITFYPMICASTETSPTYEPWENLCPIYGHGDGAGKNKLPATQNTDTINGITFTRNDDGTYTANGTATANAGFQLYTGANNTFDLANGNYILTGCPTGGGSNTYRIWVDDRNSAGTGNITSVADAGAGANITITQGKCRAYLFITSGQTVSNLVFKPMLRLASEQDATYEPYKYDGCEVNVSGKNLYGGTYLKYWYLPLPQGTTVRVRADADTRIEYCRADKSRIDYWFLQSSNDHQREFALIEDATYFRFYYTSSTGCQITLADQSWDFESFGQTYPVSWQDEAGAVYGGTVDVVSGELVATMPSNASIDLGSLNWYYEATVPRFYSYSAQNVVKKPPKNSVKANALCDRYQTVPLDGDESLYSGIDQSVAISTGGVISVRDENYTNASDFKTAVTGSQLVYELAEPITYQLTPQQIQTLVGVNNVWSEQGGVELSYHIPITNLLVKRQDVDDVSGSWLTLYSQSITQASDMDFTFIDFLNQYGKTYKYALVPLLTQTQSGVEVEIEGGYTVSDNVDSIFDGVYIADQTNVERVKAGVGYGNVDMNQGVGSITPIGSKYPIVITNSQNQYHNGSIRGTIVPNDFYSNGNLSRIDMVNKRDELEQFLTNKRAKIIKDWNGKMWLVMIMSNVSCSFDDNYGMGMVSFSADWLEVGDPTNQQDLYNAGLINVGGV